jgi:transglutaminase-like putative cysteine protease
MNIQFLEETKMLNYQSTGIQKLIKERHWKELNNYEKIKAIYGYVQNEILFGYNREDTLTAEQVIMDGYGQCNTKATLLMALLRGVGIPCRIHGFEVSKDFQRGVITGLIAALAPDRIIHTWAEVYYKGQWLALEGVITDNQYLEAVKTQYSHIQGNFMEYAIATNDFQNLSINWNENSTYVQSAAVVSDLGVFPTPDKFFEQYTQHWCKIKNFMYVYFGRKIMNYNVGKMRGNYRK